jgi:squalene-hopene/tetraprenyl-beta-curcumene cyclase
MIAAANGTGALRAALDRGTRFLIESQAPDGAWRDFEVDGAVESDAWVTGYAGAALCTVARVSRRPLAATLSAARAFLLGALEDRAGWGYARVAPVDADSTAWALAMLERSGGAPRAGYAGLRAHRRDDGGFATYRRFSDPSMWRASQADVSAVALDALLGESPRDDESVRGCTAYLLAQQRADGSWPSFWYATDLYATLHALRALARGGALPEERAAAAVHHASAAPAGRDPFVAALALAIVVRCGDPPDARRLIAELLEQQRPDGRWTAGAPLMRPDPWNFAGGDPDAAIYDQRGTFTTATVLEALALALERGEET